MLNIICLIFAGLILGFWIFLYKKNQYWNGKRVPTPKPMLLLGNYKDYLLLKKNLGENVAAICVQFPDEPLVGTYFGTEPAVIVKDPELLRLVFTKDFYYFNSRELADHNCREPFFRNIFNEANDTWRALRQNFNPLFSPAKMKNMFHLIEKNTEALRKLIDEELKITDVYEVRHFTARFTMACIASCVFGADSKVLDNSSEDNVFKRTADEIVNFHSIRAIKFWMRQIWPNIFYATGNKATQKEVESFFTNYLKIIFKQRNYVPGTRNDFVDYLLNIKTHKHIIGDSIKKLKIKDNTDKVKIEVTDEMLVAQCMVFYGAGFETSASTMGFTLFELAKRPDVQDILHQEIDKYFEDHQGKITYDCISKLPYLEACVDETMRKYAVLGVITREVVEDYTLPSGVVLQKGTRVFAPTYYMHNHPDYFPEPEVFRPERFLGENKSSIKPYTYFPFGEGPRICIGMRFARMQINAGLATILRQHRVVLPEDQSDSVSFESRSFLTQPTRPIKLKFIVR